jgi:hypothetical protein
LKFPRSRIESALGWKKRVVPIRLLANFKFIKRPSGAFGGMGVASAAEKNNPEPSGSEKAADATLS